MSEIAIYADGENSASHKVAVPDIYAYKYRLNVADCVSGIDI